jgi:hypothetical protein
MRNPAGLPPAPPDQRSFPIYAIVRVESLLSHAHHVRTSLCSALYKATGHSATATGVEHSASSFDRWLIRVLIGRIASARQRRFSARRVAERHRVPGVGRQRGTELVKLGFHTLQDVLQAGSDQLLDILKKLADGDSALKRYRGHDGSQ